jgi:hypothetical protein
MKTLWYGGHNVCCYEGTHFRDTGVPQKDEGVSLECYKSVDTIFVRKLHFIV